MLTVQPGSGGSRSAAETAAQRKLLDSLAESFARSKRAVVLVGAGISTNAGIPDFRSAGTGLYARSAAPTAASSSRAKSLKGADMFNAAVYTSPETASEHLRFLADFKTSLDVIVDKCNAAQQAATDTHDFMRLLKKRNKLLRVYTQNIDGLESIGTGLNRVPLGGMTPVEVDDLDKAGPSAAVKGKGKARAKVDGDYVQLHGTLWTVRCTSCSFVRNWNKDDHEAFADGSVGSCPACEQKASIRSARGQRSLSSLGKAFLRPAITLYDESPPGSSAFEIGDLALADADPKRGADLMLVMGTSLRIPGFKALVKQFAKTVKARGGTCILVNRDEMTSKSEWKTVFDYEVVMDSDAFVRRILDGWKRTRPRDWSGQQKTLGEMFSTQKNVKYRDGPKSTPKKREPLAELSTNPAPVQSSRNPQLATPPRSTRKRTRTATYVASDNESDGDDSEVYAAGRHSPRRKSAAMSTPSRRSPRAPMSPQSLAKDIASGPLPPLPSAGSPGRNTLNSRKTRDFTNDFTLEIPDVNIPRTCALQPAQISKPNTRAFVSAAAGAGSSRPFKVPRMSRDATPTPAMQSASSGVAC